jgi:N utilization substance protein B
MKTSTDPRHQHRIRIVQDLFAQSFHNQPVQDSETQQILTNKQPIDTAIASAAPEWPLDKVGKIDLAILRLAVYELLVANKEPEKVIIDEAVELAKEFGGDGSAPFVNGVLGTIVKVKHEQKSI